MLFRYPKGFGVGVLPAGSPSYTPMRVVCRQGLVEIKTQWCEEHKDLDRFRPPERNTLRLVWLFVLPLESIDHRDVYRVVSCDLEESLPAFI